MRLTTITLFSLLLILGSLVQGQSRIVNRSAEGVDESNTSIKTLASSNFGHLEFNHHQTLKQSQHLQSTLKAKRSSGRSSSGVHVVSNTSDTGPGSLRAAISAAAAGDTIDATGISGTITLGSNINVTKGLTIVGPGMDVLTIDGDSLYTHFVLSMGESEFFLLNSITLRRGYNFSFGGAIDQTNGKGSVILSLVQFERCYAGSYGGAIALYNSDVSLVNQSQVVGCEFVGCKSGGGNGSAIGTETDLGDSSLIFVVANRFHQNSSSKSLAFSLRNSVVVYESNIFSGNSASELIGMRDLSYLQFSNNTVSMNYFDSTVFKGLGSCRLGVFNNIIDSNSYGIAFPYLDLGSAIVSTVSHNILDISYSGPTNIMADPLFYDADGKDDIPGTADDDFRIPPCSPALDFGDSLLTVFGIDFFILKRVRGDQVDLGAIESVFESLSLGWIRVNASCGWDNGEAEPTTLGGAGGFTYLWSDGQTTKRALGLSIGSYNCIVTDSMGCSDTLTVSILDDGSIVPTADFGHSSGSGPGEVDFVNSSSSAVNYDWDFGDGGTSSAMSPSHTYASSGTYLVSLIVESVDGCMDTLSKNVTVVNVGNKELQFVNQISLFPNPANDFVELQMDLSSSESVSWSLFSMDGRFVKGGNFETHRGQINARLDLVALPTGLYRIVIEQNGQSLSRNLAVH